MTVYLVGAGPGDPGLLTRRGAELLALADVVLYDRLVDDSLLELVPSGAELLDVGKQLSGEPEESGRRQDRINELLVDHGLAGRTVVRLKGGDPFVFGRGGEEAEALRKAGVPFEVVPGVTSATAVPAAAGIPVTHRGLASSVTFVTGRVGDPTAPGGVDWASLAKGDGTIVILMGMAARAAITEALLDGGRGPETPVAVIEWGTTSRQRVSRVTLRDLPSVERASPAVIVVGSVAGLDLAGALRPLSGRTVVVTRAADQAEPLADAFSRAGARVLRLPLIAIGDPPDPGALANALARASEFDWVVFTSANAVARALAAVHDARSFAGTRIGALGRATASELGAHGLVPDLVPSVESAQGLVADFPTGSGGRVLYPRAEGASDTLAEGLSNKGWVVEDVVAYRTVPVTDHSAEEYEAAKRADALVFTSPSALAAFGMLKDRLGDAAPLDTPVLCLGPVTARAAAAAGWPVVLESPRPDAHSLVATLVSYFEGPGRT